MTNFDPRLIQYNATADAAVLQVARRTYAANAGRSERGSHAEYSTWSGRV